MVYLPADDRYEAIAYRRCGRSGLLLPAISLGLWHNFGDDRAVRRPSGRSAGAPSTSASRTSTWPTTTARRTAPAEENFGRMLATDFGPYRDELIISTKAGYDMWPGPYGDWRLPQVPARLARPVAAPDGSRLRRHLLLAPLRPRHAARGDDGRAGRPRCEQGKALYVGISSYSSARTAEAARLLRRPRHAAADPPTVVLDVQPLDRGRRSARHARARRAPAASRSRPWRRVS